MLWLSKPRACGRCGTGYTWSSKDNDITDHVYDATNAPSNLEDGRRKKNRISTAIGLNTLQNRKTRIPWVVYLLTTVQVAVFIAEIVKNSMFEDKCLGNYTDASSTIDGFSDRNPPRLQPDDRSFPIRSDQHGRSLCTVYALDRWNTEPCLGRSDIMALSKYHIIHY